MYNYSFSLLYYYYTYKHDFFSETVLLNKI